MKILTTISCALLLLVGACTQTEVLYDTKAYMSWFSKPEHGWVKKHQVNGLRLKARLLPAEYMACRIWNSTTAWDSLLQSYEGSLCLVLSFAPDREYGHSGDVMWKDLNGYEAYVQRSLEMNFNLQNDCELKLNGQAYKPALAHLENTYGLTQDRNLVLVFKAEELEAAADEVLEFSYHDHIFGTGSTHFRFDPKKMEQKPILRI